jgi:hypothetical protein
VGSEPFPRIVARVRNLERPRLDRARMSWARFRLARMYLSVFFHDYFTWLDRRAHELSQHLSGERLDLFIQQATLLLACERDILRPGLLAALLGNVPPELYARLCDEPSRVSLERGLSRLSRASSAVVFRFELGLLRDALAVAGLRAESWALFAEVVLAPEEVSALETTLLRCHDACSGLVAAPEPALRVDVLH